MPADKLIIYYFRDGLRLLIWSYCDKKDWNINDWQEIIEKDVNAKAKIACQPTSSIRENDTCCLHSYRPMKKDFEDKKDSKIKKNLNIFTNHNSNGSDQSSKLGQTLG